MVRSPSFTLFYILLSTIAVTAMGEDDFEAQERQLFDGADANKDGKLSREEARDLLVFEQLDDIDDYMDFFHDIDFDIKLSEVDKDGDGEVSKDEAKLAFGKRIEEEGELDELFQTADENEDGEITWEEFFPEYDEDMSDTDGDYEDDDYNEEEEF